MKKTSLILLLITLIFSACEKFKDSNKELSIRGKCYNSETGLPVEGAKVVLSLDYQNIDSLYSGTTGDFYFKGNFIKGENYALLSVKDDYDVGTTNFIIDNQNIERSLTMVPYGTIKMHIKNTSKNFEGISLRFERYETISGYMLSYPTGTIWDFNLDTLIYLKNRYDLGITIEQTLLQDKTSNSQSQYKKFTIDVEPLDTSEYLLEY